MLLQALTDELIIDQTRTWVNSVIIKYNFCPFARPVLAANKIRFKVIADQQIEDCLTALQDECEFLDSHQHIDTTLLIYPQIDQQFKAYLLLLDLAEQLINAQGYEGIYQLASFHPDYRFAGSDKDDPANYTNRSPYPMLHLLRETSVESALATYQQTEKIPQRNIDLSRKLGKATMQHMLDVCLNIQSKKSKHDK